MAEEEEEKEKEAAAGKRGESDRSLALALWRRSDIFYERKQMLYCLDDVRLSLREKLPEKWR